MAAERAPDLTARIVGVPASVLLPNAQRRTSHLVWGPLAAALRHEAGWAARAAAEAARWTATARPVSLALTIAWPKGRQHPDFQGAVHATKALVDGLADGKWMVDDAQVVAMAVRQVRAESGDAAGWVEVAMTVEREDEEETGEGRVPRL